MDLANRYLSLFRRCLKSEGSDGNVSFLKAFFNHYKEKHDTHLESTFCN